MHSVPQRKGKIVVFGIAFFYPLAGVTYQFLHYLLPLRRLGYDVYYIEDSSRWIYDVDLGDISPDAEPNIRAVAPILDAYGFEGRWGFRGAYDGGKCYGMNEPQIRQLYREADAFVNITGAQEIRDEHRAIPRRIYVESDPVSSQIRVAKGETHMTELLDAHDTHFTFGENLGAPDCGVPATRYRWQPTRQPVELDLWDHATLAPSGPPEASLAFNTVSNWKNGGNDIEWNGQTYTWSKHHEFMKFIDLPRRRAQVPFELATTSAPDDALSMLRENGWRVVDSLAISRDMDRYRQYIQSSRGEFTVAKDQNIRLRSGWFSDRSVCYLAAGRPVINQDTAFAKALPTGKGLFSFRTMSDACAAIDEIERDYAGNCRAAREIATEYFASDRVLESLMQRAGL